MYINTTVSAIKVPFTYIRPYEEAEGTALLDTGATENFIDHQTATQWRLEPTKLKYPRKVFNVDGTDNQAGTLTHSASLIIQINKEWKCQNFYITSLGSDCVIFSYPWFKAFKPQMDWDKGTIVGEPNICVTMFKCIINGQTPICRQAYLNRTNISVDWQIQANKDKPIEDIPEEYQRHKGVFQEFKNLPPHRPKDHKIILKPGAPNQLNCKLYPLTADKDKACKDYIDEMLAKKWIVPSTSPWTTLFFFVKKSDGTLQPVQDYRKVNDWMQKDNYPLPCIENITEKFHDKRIITIVNL